MTLAAPGMCPPKVPAAGEVPLFVVRCARWCSVGALGVAGGWDAASLYARLGSPHAPCDRGTLHPLNPARPGAPPTLPSWLAALAAPPCC